MKSVRFYQSSKIWDKLFVPKVLLWGRGMPGFILIMFPGKSMFDSAVPTTQEEFVLLAQTLMKTVLKAYFRR